MHSISLLKTDKFEEQTFIDYSQFKHGSKTVAREFGKKLADHTKGEFERFRNKTIVFFSAPHGNIPTASNALMDYLLSGLSLTFLEYNITVKQGKINRLYTYTEDYGKMSKEEREKLISKDRFIFDRTNVREEDILVFVDDIKITGQHEVKIIQMIEEEQIKNEILLMYLFEYTGDRPSIEHDLNHKSVRNLIDVNDIIRNDEFIFNTRVVKFILNSNVTEFVNFITYQSDTFRETLLKHSILNGYHLIDNYKMNFNILKTM